MSASRPAPDAAHSEPGTRYINNSPHAFLSPAICCASTTGSPGSPLGFEAVWSGSARAVTHRLQPFWAEHGCYSQGAGFSCWPQKAFYFEFLARKFTDQRGWSPHGSTLWLEGSAMQYTGIFFGYQLSQKSGFKLQVLWGKKSAFLLPETEFKSPKKERSKGCC